MAAPQQYHSLTVTHSGIARELRSPARICAGFDPATSSGAGHIEFSAIWDTGATNCVVTEKVIAACGLIPTGMVLTHGVHGTQPSKTYLVNIVLPNGVQFANVKVTEGKLGGTDLLIGMDIIGAGDFSVTNAGGKTLMSYRYPSRQSTDFVADDKTEAAVRQRQRPPPKPRGPGKQFGKKKR